MNKTAITLALAAVLASVAPVTQADTGALQLPANVTATVTASAITYNFSNLSFTGWQFLQIAGDLAGAVTGSLTGVSVNAVLNASSNATYANDLTLYVDPAPFSKGGLLQVGGDSDLGAAERHAWANGGSAAAGTAVTGSVLLATPISFTGAASNLVVRLGNGYSDWEASGTWTGSITLTGLTTVAAPVPEPSSLLLMALGGLAVAGRLGRRRATAA
ncbi:MAG TPA: PEP-CTERM sorting domain-containing protein [Roseateles sp.]